MTYSHKSPDARPHGIIGQLPPSALVHNRALIYATTNEVNQYGDDYDHAEHSARSQRLFCLMYTSTCCRRSSLEEVCAFVYRSDKGYAGLRERVGVAEEGDDSGLAARILVL